MVGRQTDGRVLLVAYHFGSAGTGAFRWNETVRHLTASRWEFDVITRAGPNAATGPSNGSGNARIRVFPVPEPAWPVAVVNAPVDWARRAARLVRPRRRPAAPASDLRAEAVVERWPRVHLGRRERLVRDSVSAGRLLGEWIWTRRAARLAARLLRRGDYSALIVSTPPHTVQLAGAWLARRFDVPYLADYRDPWDFGVPKTDYGSHPAQRQLGRRYERFTMRRARLVICNTEPAREAVDRLYGLDGRTVAIPNGYDALARVDRPDRDLFRVVYAGCLYPYHEARALLGACERFRARVGPVERRLRLEFMGAGHSYRGMPIQALATLYGLGDCFVSHEAGTRDDALRLQQSAAVLVLFDHFHGLSVPTKFYDYAQLFGTPLAIGSPDGALARAAGRVGVRVYEPGDAAGLDAALDAAYRRWTDFRYDAPTDPAGAFDRRHQSARLRQLLEGLGAAPDAE